MIFLGSDKTLRAPRRPQKTIYKIYPCACGGPPQAGANCAFLHFFRNRLFKNADVWAGQMDFWTSNWGTGESKILLNIRIAKKAKPCWNVEILKFASVSIYVGNVEHDCKCCLKSLTCCSNCWKCIWKVVENQNVKIILKQCGSRATDLVSICCLWNYMFWNNGPKNHKHFQ